MYIYLKKIAGYDISESFAESNLKVKNMLRDVNVNQFTFT